MWVVAAKVRARSRQRGTIHGVEPMFDQPLDTGRLRLWVPPVAEVLCFLRRSRTIYETQNVDEAIGASGECEDEFDTALRAFIEDFGADERIYDYEDDLRADLEAEIDELLEGDGPDEDALWELAALFAVHRFSGTWWRSGDQHGDTCSCGPVTLLEVLQSLVEPDRRQVALDAHLSVLHNAWDHYWSGDSLLRSNGTSIGGACVQCLTEGFEHLSDILEEARSVAEDLGEALAAFDTRIAIGFDRYRELADGDEH